MSLDTFSRYLISFFKSWPSEHTFKALEFYVCSVPRFHVVGEQIKHERPSMNVTEFYIFHFTHIISAYTVYKYSVHFLFYSLVLM